jgi:hypothetical protein
MLPRASVHTPTVGGAGILAACKNRLLALLLLLAAGCPGACRPQLQSPTLVATQLPAMRVPSHAVAASPTLAKLPAATLTPTPSIAFPKIDRSPRAVTMADWAPWAGRVLTATLTYDPASIDLWQVDLRTQDLSQLDLRLSLNDLMAAATFDERTIWPPASKLPASFNPQRIMDLGKNPGLGVHDLHARGITGQGIGIAIIDTPLLVDHQEYRRQLRLYEEIYSDDADYQKPANFHASAVASLAVGQSLGVAPEADLYFIATDWVDRQDANGSYRYDFTQVAQAIRRVLEINQQLPSDRKIRLISYSFGWLPTDKGYDEVTAAVDEARAQGVFVICVTPTLENIYGFKSYGLERAPLANPDKFVAYFRPLLCDLYGSSYTLCQSGRLLVPMNSRTAASPMGQDEYVFFRLGGEDWTVPYLAGMYALAAQVEPGITPERFWELALQTGRSVNINGTSGDYTLGPILDPGALIGALEK